VSDFPTVEAQRGMEMY